MIVFIMPSIEPTVDESSAIGRGGVGRCTRSKPCSQTAELVSLDTAAWPRGCGPANAGRGSVEGKIEVGLAACTVGSATEMGAAAGGIGIPVRNPSAGNCHGIGWELAG